MKSKWPIRWFLHASIGRSSMKSNQPVKVIIYEPLGNTWLKMGWRMQSSLNCHWLDDIGSDFALLLIWRFVPARKGSVEPPPAPSLQSLSGNISAHLEAASNLIMIMSERHEYRRVKGVRPVVSSAPIYQFNGHSAPIPGKYSFIIHWWMVMASPIHFNDSAENSVWHRCP